VKLGDFLFFNDSRNSGHKNLWPILWLDLWPQRQNFVALAPSLDAQMRLPHSSRFIICGMAGASDGTD
jgi:hypothetical protein